MPVSSRPSRPCSHAGCPNLQPCPVHARQPWLHRNRRPLPTGWGQLRAQVLREEPTCRSCGEPSTTVDHIIPRTQGGGDERSNLQALCKRCHGNKTQRESLGGRR